MAKNKYESYIVLFLIGIVVISIFWMRKRSEGFQNETVSVGPPTVVSEPSPLPDNSSTEPVSPSSQEMLSSIMNKTTATPLSASNMPPTDRVTGAVLRSKISELTATIGELSTIISNMK